ncbi:unnamed protein product, partial [Prunus brigantina]
MEIEVGGLLTIQLLSHGQSSVELIQLAEAKKMRESSARAKGSSSVSAADPKVDKSNPVGDALKLGCLDCSNGNDPFYAIGDGDIEMLCSDV